MSNNNFEYTGEDSRKYRIIIDISKENNLFLSIIGANDKETYSSNYYLNNLNQKFLNIIKFKDTLEFQTCLIDNIKKRTLVLKAPYKSVVNSIWKIFPNSKSKTQTFSLISSKSFDKKLDVYCYGEYSKFKNLEEELKKQLFIQVSKNTIIPKDNSFDYIKLENNWLLDNVYCLKGNYTNIQTKREAFMNLVGENKSDSGYRKVLIFFDEDNLADYILTIMQKNYTNQLFVIIYTEKDINELQWK